jgi:ribonuclease HI
MRNGDYVVCYTDGACLGNGQYGARAGIGVYFGDDHPWNVSARLNPQFRKTNNTAEIRAAIEAIYTAYDNDEYFLEIHSDSNFMIQGITNWIYSWERNGWRTLTGNPVVNRNDFLDLREAVENMNDVYFGFVPGHSGSYENHQAHLLAQWGAKSKW